MEPGVEHFFNFWRICFTLRTARGTFEVDGRQNTAGKPVFCLLCGSQALDFGAGVDKIRQESPFLSTLRTARGLLGVGGRQNTVVLLRFCLLLGPCGDF